MGPDLEGSVLSVLDEVVLVEVLDEKLCLEAGVGCCRLSGLDRLPEHPRST